MLGERLRLARKKVGLSLRALSDAIDNRVSAQAIGKYENGRMTPSSEILLALAKALGEPVDFFLSPAEMELVELEFRKRANTSARERAQVEAAVLDHVERYLEVERALGLDSACWDRPVPRQRIESPEQAEALAEQVRAVWRLGTDPLLDVTELLEEHGLKVFVIALPAKVSGLTCLVRSSGSASLVPVIVVNAEHNLERRRLTLAHELAHRVIEETSPLDAEKGAMRFAGAFLMPAEHLRERVGTHRQAFARQELIELKRLYRVSSAALIVRLEQLAIITTATRSYLFRTMARTWRKSEPEPIKDKSAERAWRFRRLCYRALGEDRISASRAAELMRLPLATLRARL